MPTLLRVDASIRIEGSVGRAVADSAASSWRKSQPDGDVVRRDLSAQPLPAHAWADAVTSRYVPAEQWSDEQRSATALVATLADELISSDALLLASPLFNFGVSQYTKVWIDLLIADPRLGPGSSALKDKPALIVVAQGGGYRAGTPRHGWDHATGYLERIFGDNFGMNVETVLADLTLAEVNPAMAHLKEAAAAALASAHDEAAQHGASHIGRERLAA